MGWGQRRVNVEVNATLTEKAAPEALPPKHACETQHLWATRKEAWQRSLAGMVVKCATGFGKGYRPVFQPMPMLCIRGVL